MTSSHHAIKTSFLVIGALLLASASWAQSRPPIAEQIAKAYGLDSWEQIDGIRYTFNIPGRKVSRTWTWEPKADRVTYEGADRVTYEGKDKDGKPVKVTYVRSQLRSQPETVKKEIDPGFINDQYWLVLPFHLVWETGATVEDKGMQKTPGGKGSARHVVMKYPSNVGYTPGDTWELYVGSDNRVQKMVFHHGGTAKPSLVDVTWEGYKKGGPLLFSTEHKGTADGKPVRVFFSDVAVKSAGSDTWVSAQ